MKAEAGLTAGLFLSIIAAWGIVLRMWDLNSEDDKNLFENVNALNNIANTNKQTNQTAKAEDNLFEKANQLNWIGPKQQSELDRWSTYAREMVTAHPYGGAINPDRMGGPCAYKHDGSNTTEGKVLWKRRFPSNFGFVLYTAGYTNGMRFDYWVLSANGTDIACAGPDLPRSFTGIAPESVHPVADLWGGRGSGENIERRNGFTTFIGPHNGAWSKLGFGVLPGLDMNDSVSKWWNDIDFKLSFYNQCGFLSGERRYTVQDGWWSLQDGDDTLRLELVPVLDDEEWENTFSRQDLGLSYGTDDNGNFLPLLGPMYQHRYDPNWENRISLSASDVQSPF
jgi:hypothetical protein